VEKEFNISVEEWKYPLIHKADFPEDVPRYPNLWFYVSEDRAATYGEAVRIVEKILRKYGLEEMTRNPQLEGCDRQVSREHLQPYNGFSNPTLNHEHSLHLRCYYKTLRDKLLKLEGDKTYLCWAMATSVHLEPAGKVHYLSFAKEHPDIQNCPICGGEGEFVAVSKIYERIRDPLGLELLLEGKVKGKRIRDVNNWIVKGIRDIGDSDSVNNKIRKIESQPTHIPEINTKKLGWVLIV